jgi:hypothetical protein
MTKLANLRMQCQIGIGIKLASGIKLAIPVSRSVLNLHPAADPRNRFLDVHATATHHIYIGANDISLSRDCPHLPMLQKRVQSRAYAPPQGPPTRSPPITRDATIPLAAAHTLAAFFSYPAADQPHLMRLSGRGRADERCALLPRQTERRIAPGRGSAPCPSQEGVLEPAFG